MREERRADLLDRTSDDELLISSQVNAIFGIPPDALREFLRAGTGPQPTLVGEEGRQLVRYRFGELREFYQSESYQAWRREYEERQGGEAEKWRALFRESFSSQELPSWLTKEMAIGLRAAIKDMVRDRLAEQFTNKWSAECERLGAEALPQRVFDIAEAEAGKRLGHHISEVMSDPKIQELIRERAVERMVVGIEQHPAARRMAPFEADWVRVKAAMDAAGQVREAGWVYMIQASSHSDIKIGKAMKLANRLSGHRSSNPHLRLVASFRGYTALEGRLHEIFHPYRMHGEWFIFSATVQEFVRQSFDAGLALRPEITGPFGEKEAEALAMLSSVAGGAR